MEKSEKITTAMAAAIVLLAVAVAGQSIAIHRLNVNSRNEVQAERKSLDSSVLHNPTQASQPKPLRKNDNNDETWPAIGFDTENWDPFQEMERMNDRMNRMFNDAFGRFEHSPRFNNLFRDKQRDTSFDITDDGDHYTVKLDMPGIDQSQIQVSVDGQTLSVSGKTDSKTEKKEKGRIIRQERRSGNFERSMTLPEPVKADEMKTETRNGVVTITIPKADKMTLQPHK